MVWAPNFPKSSALWCTTCLVLCLLLWLLFILSSWLYFNCVFHKCQQLSELYLDPLFFSLYFLSSENLLKYGLNSYLYVDKLELYYSQHRSLLWVLDSYLQQSTGYFFLMTFRYFTWNKLLIELITFYKNYLFLLMQDSTVAQKEIWQWSWTLLLTHHIY